MKLNLTSAPTVEPVTLEEAKAHLKVDSADDNALISAMITTARTFAEQYTRRAFITQTLELVLDAPPSGDLKIPRPPVQSVTKIETIDEAGVKSEVSALTYMVELGTSSPGRIRLVSGCTWPVHREFASFIVTFQAGYGAAAIAVPQPIRTAILQLVSELYENRGAGELLLGTQPTTNAQQMITVLLGPYKVFKL
jgi:uncharacterized phiE125 gp8 family phage protein